ncbi:MAG: hypothetical protein C4306_07395 [Thermoleophilia bacterium]
MAVLRLRPLASALVRLERLASRPLGAIVLFVLSLGVYALRALGWPLQIGRDLDEYLYVYIQLLDRHPLLPWSMLFRTPVTPIVAGLSLDVAGGALAEPVMAVLFAASVVAWSAAAAAFSARAAILVACALLVYPAYGLMFHELCSEPVFSAAYALLALLVVRAWQRPSGGRFVWVGLGIALCALVRPGNAVLLVLALFPVAVPGTWRERLRWTATLLVAALAPLGAWTLHNGLRLGDYALARGGNAVIPFYRAFVTDRIVSPHNGPASRRLAEAIAKHLLTREPYRSYGVTLDQVFRSGSFRIHEDLYLLSDQVFGWKSDYAILRDAGVEAVRAHPDAYARGVLDTVWLQLSRSYFRAPGGGSQVETKRPPTIVVHGRRLPDPGEDQPIPAGQSVWISRPDNSIRDVWTSPTRHRFVFGHQGDRRRFQEIVRERDRLLANLPHRQGQGWLALRLNQLSRWYPRPILWIAVGVLALLWRRPRGARTLVALALSALLVIVLNALGLFADPHFALPVAPAFVLLGAGALLGRRASPRLDARR